MTSDRSPSPAPRWIGVLLVGIAATAVVFLALVDVLKQAGGTMHQVLSSGGAGVASVLGMAPLTMQVVLWTPLAAALVAGLIASAGRSTRLETTAAVPAGAPPASPPPERGEAALRLLALLQQEGRFVDFLEEDLGPYSDTQIGAAVRSIHEGCRTALKERLSLAPILPGAEGSTVTVEPGFDPAAVRVTGNVRGEPPYQGVLRHPGWRSASFRLPEATGDRDHSILAPAEVEVL